MTELPRSTDRGEGCVNPDEAADGTTSARTRGGRRPPPRCAHRRIRPRGRRRPRGARRRGPAPDATLGAGPLAIRLSFSEQPETGLSEVHVLDADGVEQESGPPEPVAGDPLTLALPVPQLPRGVYSVTYRVVSAVDGHANSGAYAFGVGVSPEGAVAEAPSAEADTSWLELVARWPLLIGLVALLGAAAASVGRFGGSAESDLKLAAAGWLLSAVGLVLLAVAQRWTAGASLGELFGTTVGEALIWRAVAIGAAGAALLLAWRSPGIRRGALAAAGLAATAAIAVHVDAGHAASSSWPSTVTVTAQVAHFAAVGVWFGGLAALLLGIRGAPSADKAARCAASPPSRRAPLLVVVVTGTLRAVDELSSLDDLITTAYGLAVLEKIALIAAIVALAVRNRRSVPAAASDLGPIRAHLPRRARPRPRRPRRGGCARDPGACRRRPRAGSIGRFGLRKRLGRHGAGDLRAESAVPGPNRFVAQVDDSSTGEPVQADVSLRFRPLDDPGVAGSTLELKPGADGSYAGSGRTWHLTAAGESRCWSSVAATPRSCRSSSICRFRSSSSRCSGSPAAQRVHGAGWVRRLHPDCHRSRARRARTRSTSPSTRSSRTVAPTDQLVVTARAGDDDLRQQPVRRLGKGRFVAEVEFEEGPTRSG